MSLPPMDPPADRPYPCQGSWRDCSWWAAKPHGLCPECAVARSREAAVLDLGPALREGRAPWVVLPEAPRPPADVVPPRPAWAVWGAE